MDVVDRLLGKARQSLRRLDAMAAIADEEAARREAYFAAFHAARALLFARTGLIERSHEGVRIAFGRYAVSFGFPPEPARFLATAHRYLAIADYEIKAPSPEMSVDEARRAAEEFLAAVEAELADG